MATLPLEDNFNDIIGKAARGLKLSPEALAAKAGLDVAKVSALLDGEFDEASARQVAPVLALNADALATAGRKSYAPAPITLPGLAQFNTPYEDMTVNAYLVWDAATREAVAFDTGADASDMLDLIKREGLRVVAILLTHTHGDHIFDLDRLMEKTGAKAFVGERESVEGAEPFPAGHEWICGALTIESRLTWGHSKGGITFYVQGLSKPVAIVGDAVFAGSMGGGSVSYEAALETNRREIFTFSPETILCPGHGPLTTVSEELKNNPFYAV